MEAHRQLTDREFEDQFSNGEFPAAWFSHEAHLRLAWIHLDQYGLAGAMHTIPLQIQRFVAALGASDKYNHTVTLAAIQAVHHFRQKATSSTFEELIAEFPRLKYNFQDLLAAHYSYDLFHSTAARTQYQAPDLLPFT